MCEFLEEIFVFLETHVRPETGQCFDPADSGSDTRFSNDLEQPDIPRHFRMGTAAQLHAYFRNRNDSNLLLILLSKECKCSLSNRFVDFHDPGLDWKIPEDHLVDLLFDLLDFPIG